MIGLCLTGCTFPTVEVSSSPADALDAADSFDPVDSADASGEVSADAIADATDSVEPSTDAPPVDTSTGDTSSGDGLPDVDAPLPDVVLPEAPVDASDPCDKDGDGYKAKGGTCGGNDCDDTDPRAHPDPLLDFVTFDATASKVSPK